MPKLSPTMEDGVLQAWHKKEGDRVNVDDLLAEVETDKATMEFRAFDKGTLLKILVTPGTQVKLGQAVAVIGEPGDDISALVKQVAQATQATGQVAQATEQAPLAAPVEAESVSPAPGVSAPASVSAPAREAGANAAASVPPVAAGSRSTRRDLPRDVLRRTEEELGASAVTSRIDGTSLASPYVRKTARERGIDLSRAQGSGQHGRIVPSDLEALRAQTTSGSSVVGGSAMVATSSGALARPEVRPLSPMRKTIARRLTQSKQTVPHFYLQVDVDAGALVALREKVNSELALSGSHAELEKPQKISINDLLIKACATALTRVPECNAQFTEEAILVHNRVDISVAVAIAEGLVTPVVRDANKKTVVAIASEVRDLAARARAKKLKPEEMTDGTFSISNLGMFGIDNFAAVINPPEGAILAVGQVRDVPVVRSGVVEPGKRLAMTLSCDHRVVDGAVGAAFLAELRTLLEHPMRILTG